MFPTLVRSLCTTWNTNGENNNSNNSTMNSKNNNNKSTLSHLLCGKIVRKRVKEQLLLRLCYHPLVYNDIGHVLWVIHKAKRSHSYNNGTKETKKKTYIYAPIDKHMVCPSQVLLNEHPSHQHLFYHRTHTSIVYVRINMHTSTYSLG